MLVDLLYFTGSDPKLDLLRFGSPPETTTVFPHVRSWLVRVCKPHTMYKFGTKLKSNAWITKARIRLIFFLGSHVDTTRQYTRPR
jgi:hypothetical protein